MNYPYPHLHLLVSGGNTRLLYLRSWTEQELLGETRDDAAGECLDKTGRLLGLPYPAGVFISKIAGLKQDNQAGLPVGMQHSQDYNFSFSGLKTAVRYYLQKQLIDPAQQAFFRLEQALTDLELQTLMEMPYPLDKQVLQTTDPQRKRLQIIKLTAVSIQTVVVQALTGKLFKAAENLPVCTVGLSGGVSANPLLRSQLEQKFGEKLLLAPKSLTGDNAVMIGLAGALDLIYH